MRVSVGKVVTEGQWYNSRWAVCIEHLGKSTGVVEKTGGVSSTSPCISPIQEGCSSLLGAKVHCFAAPLKYTLERMRKTTESHQWLIYAVQTSIATQWLHVSIFRFVAIEPFFFPSYYL